MHPFPWHTLICVRACHWNVMREGLPKRYPTAKKALKLLNSGELKEADCKQWIKDRLNEWDEEDDAEQFAMAQKKTQRSCTS